MEEEDKIEQSWREFNKLFKENLKQKHAAKDHLKIHHKIDEQETYQFKCKYKDEIADRKNKERIINRDTDNSKLI